jgi:tetraacyldisaccharide 4'-kinase
MAGKVAGWPPVILLPLLIPLSYIYRTLTWVHRSLYAYGILRKKRLPRPVVSVGNLTVGGGGKTPLVLWLAGTLRDSGVRPAILSRGYGRKGSAPTVVDLRHPWRQVGDEPYMMASRLDQVPVAVAADRYEAGLEVLREHEVDLFILDDGFQHRRLERDLDILVIDNVQRFGNGRLLPAGLLREPLTRLSDADQVVMTRAAGPDEEFGKFISSSTRAGITWSDYRSTGLKPLGGGKETVEECRGPFLAFCGIAGPEGFSRSLEKHGLDIVEMVIFPDHHPYKDEDLERIAGIARSSGALALVTTEKDAVRLPAGKQVMPCFSLVVELDAHGSDQEILAPVLDLVRPYSGDRLS